MTIFLGCIADDFTGATDLAGFLVKQGFRTVQFNGIPAQQPNLAEVDAVVIALKSRTISPSAAIAQSLAALKLLKAWQCQQFYFKYCSTFDSTEKGNIGPVIDALLDALEEEFTIVCPALPVNGRSLYQGHLFVNGVLLHETGMADHPLTPMTDSNLLRVLSKQVTGKVGLLAFEVVQQGSEEIRQALQKLKAEGIRYAIVDALSDQNLRHIGHAVKGLKLITGGSGLSMALIDNCKLEHTVCNHQMPKIPGNVAMLSGSCSLMTQQQVALAKQKFPSFYLDPIQLLSNPGLVDDAIDWALQHIKQTSVLLYTTSSAENVKQIQDLVGVEKAGSLAENTLMRIAKALATAGIRKFLIAGGETSGAILKELKVTAMGFGPEIAPGIPWTFTLEKQPLALALKSGNFGSANFFENALEKLQ